MPVAQVPCYTHVPKVEERSPISLSSTAVSVLLSLGCPYLVNLGCAVHAMHVDCIMHVLWRTCTIYNTPKHAQDPLGRLDFPEHAPTWMHTQGIRLSFFVIVEILWYLFKLDYTDEVLAVPCRGVSILWWGIHLRSFPLGIQATYINLCL